MYVCMDVRVHICICMWVYLYDCGICAHVCMCAWMCVHRYVYVCEYVCMNVVYVHTYAEAPGRCQLSCHPSPYFFTKPGGLEQVQMILLSLTSQHESPLSMCGHGWLFMWALAIWTQVFMLQVQALLTHWATPPAASAHLPVCALALSLSRSLSRRPCSHFKVSSKFISIHFDWEASIEVFCLAWGHRGCSSSARLLSYTLLLGVTG